MPRLNIVERETATHTVADLYEGIPKNKGKVFNIFKGLANRPPALKTFLDFDKTMGAAKLTAAERGAVALEISQDNECTINSTVFDLPEAPNLDSAESSLRIFQEILSIRHAKYFRKPDDDWYINIR